MEAKVLELTGCVKDAGSRPENTRVLVDRMFGIVDDRPKPRTASAPPFRPAPPRYPAVLVDRLFAAAEKAWKRVWNPKFAGERIEMLFMYEAARRGLIVSKPFGDSARYDAIVENPKHPGKLWRVQVRSTSFQSRGWYIVRTDSGSQRRVLTPKEADIFAVYIVPEEVWYLVPVSAVQHKQTMNFSPHRPRLRRTPGYERFREAWNLIGADIKPTTNTR